MSHEQTETIQREDGRWVNVTKHGKQVGRSHSGVVDAVRAAVTRSRRFNSKNNTQTDDFGRGRKVQAHK